MSPQGRPGKGKGKGPKGSGRHGGRGSGSAVPRGRRDAPRHHDAHDRPERRERSGPPVREGGRGKERGRAPAEEGKKRGLRTREDGGQVCVIARAGKFLVAEPFFANGDPRVLGRGAEAELGALVLVIPQPDGSLEIAERLGNPEVALDVIAALLRERDFDPKHSDEVLEAADAAVHTPDPTPERRDLRALPTFTIDPETAKDFDDAISAEPQGDAALVRVHIADVTSFAPVGGIVDRAGRARATSTYVPGLVVPMLPPQLADDACSLVPGVDRRAVTIEMLVQDGVCQRAEVYRSTIRSDARLTYEDVDAIFAGEAEPDAVIAAPLALARKVAQALVLERPQALELDIPEPQFTFDPSGAVVAQRASENTESHKLIEMLMVLANEQVARILQANGAPALYRVHDKPDATGATKLVAQLASLGIHTPGLPEGDLTPVQATEVVAACSREIGAVVRAAGKGRSALPLLVLRALKLAVYDPECRGHAGLGLTHYCHFTSPIRRYPDIVCHRSVLELAERGRAVIGAESDVPSADARPEDDPLQQLAEHCSDQERSSMSVEREADRIAKAFLLRDRLREGGAEEVWHGEVTGMIQPGMFINFGGGFDGMVPLRSLKGDWWEMNEEGTAFYAEGSGAMVRLGDDADVVVDSVDVARGRVDLVPMAIGGNLDADRREREQREAERSARREAPRADRPRGERGGEEPSGDERGRHRGKPRRDPR